MTQQTRPLDGLRVLDLSRAVSGPFAGRILADLGADVVRAELPGTDVTQAFGKVTRGRSGLYSHVNAGKRSILLDLHQPGDVARLLDLAAACDVLVENFRPGVLDRFGAGWPALSAVNPRLVMLSISGFGREGDDAGRPAYAPVIHAEAGLIGRQADITGEPPADIAFALADALAGLHGTIAVLAALRLRDHTGTGQHIDLSMLEAMLATDDYTHYSIDEQPVRSARGEIWPAPGGPILISADRRYLWRQLKTCFGVADPDPDAPLEDKLRVRAGVMADWFAAHPDRDALKRDLESARLPWADIRHAGDVLAAASVAGRDTVVEVTDGDGKRRSVARMPYRFSDAASGPVRGVPEPGEHTDDVLRDWTTPADLPAPRIAPRRFTRPAIDPADLPRGFTRGCTSPVRLSHCSPVRHSGRRNPGPACPTATSAATGRAAGCGCDTRGQRVAPDEQPTATLSHRGGNNRINATSWRFVSPPRWCQYGG